MKSALSLIALALAPAVFASNGAHGNRLTRKHQHRAAQAQVDKDLMAKRSNIEVRDDHNNTLTKRAFSGRGTYYYTDVGLGACGESRLLNRKAVDSKADLAFFPPFDSRIQHSTPIVLHHTHPCILHLPINDNRCLVPEQ